MNVVPPPGSLATSSVPPSSSVSLRESGRPSPVPFACWGPGTWTNSSKIRARSRAAIPMPVSITRRQSRGRRALGVDGHGALGGELDRVADQVAQDLDELALVGAQRGQVGLGDQVQLEPALLGQRPQLRPQQREQLGHRDRADLEVHPAGLDLGDVQQVADQLELLLGHAPDEPHLRDLLGLERRLPPISSSVSAMIELSGVRSSWLMSARKRDLRSSASRSSSARSSSSA